jgi:hypothetical protein
MSWIGTLPGWLTVFTLALLAIVYVRAGGGQALDVLETANRILTDRVKTLEDQLIDARKVIEQLGARTNLEPILSAVVEGFTRHEVRAQERHDAQLKVLALIAQRFGPDEED